MKDKHKIMYMKMAQEAARTSSGVKLKVGTVIVKNNNPIATGYNGLPEHVHGALEDDTGQTKPQVRHSEKNALMALTKSTSSSLDSVLFCTHACCEPCAIDIVDAGIKEFYYVEDYKNTLGIEYLKRNKIPVHKLQMEGV